MTNNEFVAFTEIHTQAGIERWFYGAYDRDTANRVAEQEIRNEYPIFGGVCPAQDAKSYHVQNLPARLR